MAVYFIADIKVEDPTTYEEYRKLVKPTLERYGGKFLARGGATETIEGGDQQLLILYSKVLKRVHGEYIHDL